MIVISGGRPNLRTIFLPSMAPLTLCQPGLSLYREPQEYMASTPLLLSFSTTTVVDWLVPQHTSRSPCQMPDRLATAGDYPRGRRLDLHILGKRRRGFPALRHLHRFRAGRGRKRGTRPNKGNIFFSFSEYSVLFAHCKGGSGSPRWRPRQAQQ